MAGKCSERKEIRPQRHGHVKNVEKMQNTIHVHPSRQK